MKVTLSPPSNTLTGTVDSIPITIAKDLEPKVDSALGRMLGICRMQTYYQQVLLKLPEGRRIQVDLPISCVCDHGGEDIDCVWVATASDKWRTRRPALWLRQQDTLLFILKIRFFLYESYVSCYQTKCSFLYFIVVVLACWKKR